MSLAVKDAVGATQSLKTTTDGSDQVPHHVVDSSALPTGASTEATLANLLAAANLLAKLTDTQPISAAALPLPAGAATQATLAGVATQTTLAAILTAIGLQATANTTLSVNQIVPSPSLSATLSGVADTADHILIAAGGGSLQNCITALSAFNASATATWFNVKDGSTVIYTGFLAANSGQVIQLFSLQNPLMGTAATAVNVACETNSTACRFNASFFRK